MVVLATFGRRLRRFAEHIECGEISLITDDGRTSLSAAGIQRREIVRS
jgi:hypothetical protein